MRTPHRSPGRLPAPRTATRLALPALALAALAACGDDALAPTAPAPSLAVAAAPAAPGTGLVFLAPLGPTLAEYRGTFDGTRAPVVEICRWAGAACEGAPVARYTLAEGTGGEPLRVVTDEQHYRADWKAKDRPAGAVYRVRVLLGGAEVGAASARVLRPGETEAAVLAAGYAPVSQSQAFLVRFRLETSRDYLPGAPGVPAAGAIPDLPFVARAQDYSAGHPTLPKALLSHNTIMLVPAATATVAELNALIAQLGAATVGGVTGVPGKSGGVLALRLPTTTHQQLAARLAELARDPRVKLAVQDATVRPNAVPRDNGQTGWTWERTPAGGNWGLELTRVPQMWNLNAAVAKSIVKGSSRAGVGVLDGGFMFGHPDVVFDRVLSPGTDTTSHGLMVAGVIGATHDNARGVDGVDPFARMLAQAVGNSVAGTATAYQAAWSVGEAMVYGLTGFIRKHQDVPVINMSLSYNWGPDRINTTADTAAQRIATAQGAALVEALGTIPSLPLIVTAAGNDSDPRFGLGPQQARWAGPLENAALVHGARNIVVVGALARRPAEADGVARAAYSNVGAGLLWAPGSDIHTANRTDYESVNGTSFAAPHVAGLVSYLYTLAPSLPRPTLDRNPVLDLLVATGRAAGDAGGRRFDAFAAAMATDSLLGTDRVLRMLVDVDDGTLDGNERLRADGTANAGEDADGDGGSGDGTVDMSDFRRWRDWLLQAENAADVLLDGDVRHRKKDVNGNGRFAADGDDENVFPRGDFNGDGRLSRGETARVDGVIRAAATDLAVLAARWADSDVPADSLPLLVNSADLHVDASACLAFPGAASVQSRVWPTSAELVPVAGKSHLVQFPTRVYTVAVAGGGRTAAVDVKDAAGKVIASAERDFGTLPRGADAHWRPACVALAVTPEAAQLAPGATRQFAATVTGSADQAVTWTASGGSVTAAGLYTAPNSAGTYTVVARHAASGARREALVTVKAAPSAGRVVAPENASSVLVGGSTYDPNKAPMKRAEPAPSGTSLTYSDDVSGSSPPDQWGPGGSFSGTASGTSTVNFGWSADAGGSLRSITGSSNSASTATMTVTGSPNYLLTTEAWGQSAASIEFFVVDAAVPFTFTGSCARPGGAGGVFPMVGASLNMFVGGNWVPVAAVDCGAESSGSASGVLQPGRYTVVAHSTAPVVRTIAGQTKSYSASASVTVTFP